MAEVGGPQPKARVCHEPSFSSSSFFFLRIVSNFNSLGTLVLLMPAGLFWCLHNRTLTWTALSLSCVCDLFSQGDDGAPVYCTLNTGEFVLYGQTRVSTCTSGNTAFNVIPVAATAPVSVPLL